MELNQFKLCKHEENYGSNFKRVSDSKAAYFKQNEAATINRYKGIRIYLETLK